MRRNGAYWIAAFPIALAIGILTIPLVPDYADHGVAADAAWQVERWYWGHLISAVAFGVAVPAAVAFRARVLSAGSLSSGIIALSLISVGVTLYAVGLGADGIAPLANIAAGASPQTYFDGSGLRLSGVFMAATTAFVVGWIYLFVQAARVGLLRGTVRWAAVTGVVLFGAAGAIPSGWGLYALAAIALALWLPLGVLVARISVT